MKDKKLLLLLDTTLKGIGVGLAARSSTDTELITSAFHFIPDGSAACIGRFTREVLRQALGGEGLERIDYIVVSNGPGSFTGIKVGLSYALGLARSTSSKLKVLGVSSLESLLKEQVRRSNTKTAFFLKATRTGGYLAVGDRDAVDLFAINIRTPTPSKGEKPAGLHETIEIRDDKTNNQISTEILHQVDNINLVFPWEVLERLFEGVGVCYTKTHYPTIAMKALLGMAIHAPIGEPLEAPLVPRYMRKSTPEERLLKDRGQGQ